MNKYLSTLIFYISAAGIIFILNKISPNQQDGGLGFGALAILVFTIIVIGLFLFNIYKGFSVNKEFFIIAGIHFLVLVGYLQRLFL